MANDTDILAQLTELRRLFAESRPSDRNIVENYAWTICKVLNSNYEKIGALQCRQLLAEYMKLDIERPSKLHSAMLNAAAKIALAFVDFHFIPFLGLWDINNLRDEDFAQQKDTSGKAFPSLAERVAKAYIISSLMRQDEVLPPQMAEKMNAIVSAQGYHRPLPMVVTRITEALSNGRKIRFASLVSADGTEAMCELHNLKPNPAVPTISRSAHYVNVGNLYDVVLKDKKSGDGTNVHIGLLASKSIADVFPTLTGYVEHIDAEHKHIHIYDSLSRHLVASGQRLTVQVGNFVRIVPVVPAKNKFKSAIILKVLPQNEGRETFGLREIKITFVNMEKGFVAWDLTDSSQPIIEAGTTEPSYTSGYIPTDFFLEHRMSIPKVGDSLRAVMFLKRGKDAMKRPHVVLIV